MGFQDLIAVLGDEIHDPDEGPFPQPRGILSLT